MSQNRCKTACIVAITVLFMTHSVAASTTPHASFDRINTCIKMQNSARCRTDITADSVELYDRFMSYGLMRCLPKDVAYVSEETKENHVFVRASTKATATEDNKRYMRLAFVEEEGAWKLDVPASLERSMGQKWQQKVATIEQLYLMLRTQMGGQLDCGMVQALANSKKK